MNRQLRRSDRCQVTIEQILPIVLPYCDWFSPARIYFPKSTYENFSQGFILANGMKCLRRLSFATQLNVDIQRVLIFANQEK